MAFEGGLGATLNIGDGNVASTPIYTAIAQVENFGELGIESVMAESRPHDATGGYMRKVPSGAFNVDDIELELALDMAQATHANSSGGLVHALLNKTQLAYQIILPDTSTTTATFDAYVSKFSITSETEDMIKATATLSVDGQVVLS